MCIYAPFRCGFFSGNLSSTPFILRWPLCFPSLGPFIGSERQCSASTCRDWFGAECGQNEPLQQICALYSVSVVVGCMYKSSASVVPASISRGSLRLKMLHFYEDLEPDLNVSQRQDKQQSAWEIVLCIWKFLYTVTTQELQLNKQIENKVSSQPCKRKMLIFQGQSELAWNYLIGLIEAMGYSLHWSSLFLLY